MDGDIARNKGGASAFCGKGADLLIHGANLGALIIIEDWQIDRARQMIIGKFSWRAHVDDHVVITGIPALNTGDWGAHHAFPPVVKDRPVSDGARWPMIAG